MQPLRAFLSATLFMGAAWGQGPPVIMPRVVERHEPSMTEEARRALVNAVVVLTLTVNAKGEPANIHVARGAGFGLDEEAVRAVGMWRFDPGLRDGKPVGLKTSVEINYRLLDGAHDGQLAGLVFTLPEGVARPELLRGRVPGNPLEAGPASVRVAFTITPDGSAREFSVLEAKPAAWGSTVLEAMSAWQFRMAANGPAVQGVFEISRGIPVPRAGIPMVRLPSGAAEDVSLPAPKLIAPAEGAVLSASPRHTECRWEPSIGAVSYVLQWDYSYNGLWHSEDQNFHAGVAVESTAGSFEFQGAQPGRWRVWPVGADGRRGNPSEWRTFSYTR